MPRQWSSQLPRVVRGSAGKGLLLGVKLKVEPRAFVQHLRDKHRLLTVAAGDQTIRVLPPLVVGEAEIDEFFDKLSAGASDYPIPEAAS